MSFGTAPYAGRAWISQSIRPEFGFAGAYEGLSVSGVGNVADLRIRTHSLSFCVT